MFRPWNIVRWVAGLYCFGAGVGFGGQLLWKLLRDGALYTGGGPRHLVSTAEAASLILWCIAAAICGWRGMDREAA